jgi:hypothetical protein
MAAFLFPVFADPPQAGTKRAAKAELQETFGAERRVQSKESPATIHT